MVGSAVWRALEAKGYTNLVGKTSQELDLRDQANVNAFYNLEKPDVVIDAAAKVGGILANNDFPYQFLMENMQIQNNLIDGSLKYNTKNFIFLGSSCIYPKFSNQPIKEQYLLTNSLEPTNEWYAIAKISGVKAFGYPTGVRGNFSWGHWLLWLLIFVSVVLRMEMLRLRLYCQ